MFADKNSAAPHLREAEDNLLGAHSRIGEQLRAFYTEIQEEQIPRNLLILLERLEEAEKDGAAPAAATADLAAGQAEKTAESAPAAKAPRRRKGSRHG